MGRCSTLNGLCLVALLFAAPIAVAADPAGDGALTGFRDADAHGERAVEKRFMAVPDESSAGYIHGYITAKPHMAGSSGDRRIVEFLRNRLRAYGLKPAVDTHEALLSLPRRVKFVLLGPQRRSGPRQEGVADGLESPVGNRTPPFNAYSGSGHVVAPVVYANYGLPADYEYLRRAGIPVKDTILVVRYGAAYRGVKAMLAEQHGAAALVLYSDPQDDGFRKGDVYPNGPWRPASGVQRGSALYEFLEPGTVEVNGGNAPRIPVLSISAADADPILRGQSGAVAPTDWQGGLPFTYHIGPGSSRLAVTVDMEERRTPIWNIVVKIRGAEIPDEVVVLGNHHDAWVYGGIDPGSGTTALLEVARGLGELVRSGWRPRRSIWICFWDGEEFGEFGSVAWVEENAALLSKSAVAYLNLDSAVSGSSLFASTVPSLRDFVIEAARSVPDPSGGSLFERATALLRADVMSAKPADRESPTDANAAPNEPHGFEPTDLGGGTDFVSFFDHLGIPSVDLGFEGGNGVYHSVFDNHRWMTLFGDPRFRYHVAISRLVGIMALRLANADVLPFDYEMYGRAIQGYLKSLARRAALMSLPPLSTDAADHEAAGFARTGADLRWHYSDRDMGDEPLLARRNTALMQTERALLTAHGLPGREWYRHSIFAPGLYSGYEPAVLPAATELVDEGRSVDAQKEVDSLVEVLKRATTTLLEGSRK